MLRWESASTVGNVTSRKKFRSVLSHEQLYLRRVSHEEIKWLISISKFSWSYFSTSHRCGENVDSLYIEFSEGNIRLTRCVSVNRHRRFMLRCLTLLQQLEFFCLSWVSQLFHRLDREPHSRLKFISNLAIASQIKWSHSCYIENIWTICNRIFAGTSMISTSSMKWRWLLSTSFCIEHQRIDIFCTTDKHSNPQQ